MQTTYLNASVELDFDLRRLQIRSEEHSVVVTEKKSKIKGFEHCGAVLHKWVRQWQVSTTQRQSTEKLQNPAKSACNHFYVLVLKANLFSVSENVEANSVSSESGPCWSAWSVKSVIKRRSNPVAVTLHGSKILLFWLKKRAANVAVSRQIFTAECSGHLDDTVFVYVGILCPQQASIGWSCVPLRHSRMVMWRPVHATILNNLLRSCTVSFLNMKAHRYIEICMLCVHFLVHKNLERCIIVSTVVRQLAANVVDFFFLSCRASIFAVRLSGVAVASGGYQQDGREFFWQHVLLTLCADSHRVLTVGTLVHLSFQGQWVTQTL